MADLPSPTAVASAPVPAPVPASAPAKRTSAPAKPPAQTIDDAVVYRVDLIKSFQVGRTMIHPGQNVKLRGDFLRQAHAVGCVASFKKA